MANSFVGTRSYMSVSWLFFKRFVLLFKRLTVDFDLGLNSLSLSGFKVISTLCNLTSGHLVCLWSSWPLASILFHRLRRSNWQRFSARRTTHHWTPVRLIHLRPVTIWPVHMEAIDTHHRRPVANHPMRRRPSPSLHCSTTSSLSRLHRCHSVSSLLSLRTLLIAA